MNLVVLLTGATGFLGTYIAEALCFTTDARLIVLVRSVDEQTAIRRMQRAWWDHQELVQQIGKRIDVIAGDVTYPDLQLDVTAYRELTETVTHIIHAAADLRLHAPLEQMRLVNVAGTQNMLRLAGCIHRHHGLQRFSHVSTAYVAGKRQGAVSEDDLADAFGFNNAYEQSKFEAEQLVRNTHFQLPVSVFRPGMIVGHSKTGAVKTFNTLYYPLRLYLAGHLRLIPVNPSLCVNMVPVDYVASAIVHATIAPSAVGTTFHLTAPNEMLPTVRELIDAVRTWATECLQTKPPKPVYLPLPLHQSAVLLPGTLGKLQSLAGYFHEQRVYSRENADRFYGPYPHQWRTMLPQLLEYATQHGFLHRSERTVHEQLLFRLNSKSRPVVFADIVGNRTVPVSAGQMRREINAIAASLSAFGIKPGDLVAITGLNSTRHVAINAAIGLIGAVSVPLYYTSPPQEIAAIVADSGAKLLLVGSPKMLPQLGELAKSTPVVSFCRDPIPDSAQAITSWEAFLQQGADHPEPQLPLVLPDDPATVCYTSGTTGMPKGVVFTHRQLRWMAENIAALPPWPQRNKTIRYISFLPLSHVVEGILGAYAPYYAPAALRMFYLEQFSQLPTALRLAQPTFFFSVPRFYEKLWEKAVQNPLIRLFAGRKARSPRVGRLFAGRKARPPRVDQISTSRNTLPGYISRMLGRLVLWRAGLHRCGYLVVGSAPVSEQLLCNLAQLGIAVHNAYGLTEAPLITINRPGHNQLHTVGAPLPQTQLSISPSGEILVCGPQVAAHYHGNAQSKPLLDADWLRTGDLGRLNPDGHLVVEGRQKDIIVTAYGKNIAPGKIETMLRQLPGIQEALLIGEGRPYCTAILWMDKNSAHAEWEEFDQQIAAINTQLSHPEQVKRWLVLPYHLTVETGELTANLKLRRDVVVRKLAAQIADLYDYDTSSVYNTKHAGSEPPALHIGKVGA